MPSSAAPNMRPADGFGFITPPPLSARVAERRRQQSSRRETLAELYWTLQDHRCWSRPSRRHSRRPPPWRQAVIPWPPFKSFGPCSQTSRRCGTLQALRQPIRCRRTPLPRLPSLPPLWPQPPPPCPLHRPGRNTRPTRH